MGSPGGAGRGGYDARNNHWLLRPQSDQWAGHARLRIPFRGERTLPVERQTPAGAGVVPRFALFASSDDAVSRLLRGQCDLREPDVRPPIEPSAMWPARRDGHTAAVAENVDIRPIANYLEALRGTSSLSPV